jgi:ribosomal RNA-processing protein 9
MARQGTRKHGKVAAKTRAKKTKGNDAAFDWGDNHNITSDVEKSEDDEMHVNSDEDEQDPYAKETADEARVRLAKAYLGKLKDTMDDEEGSGNEEDLARRVSSQLDKDVQEASGKLFKVVAEQLMEFEFDEESCKFLKGHRLSVTAVCTSEDGKIVYSASKDGTILKWNTVDGSKVRLSLPHDIGNNSKDSNTQTRMYLNKSHSTNKANRKNTPDHKKTILALAMSSDNQFIASGGVDKLLHVWHGDTNALLESFSGHRDSISCLTFRKKSHMLFSGSFDRTIKHWNITEMGYVETLFGHQHEITGLDSLVKDRVVSCGRDSSVRVWKIPEETQLVFHGVGSLDAIAMVNDDYYVTGGDQGRSLSLYIYIYI